MTNEHLPFEWITGRWDNRVPSTKRFPFVLSDLIESGKGVTINATDSLLPYERFYTLLRITYHINS